MKPAEACATRQRSVRRDLSRSAKGALGRDQPDAHHPRVRRDAFEPRASLRTGAGASTLLSFVAQPAGQCRPRNSASLDPEGCELTNASRYIYIFVDFGQDKKRRLSGQPVTSSICREPAMVQPLIPDAAAFQKRLAALPLRTYQAGEVVFAARSKTGQL